MDARVASFSRRFFDYAQTGEFPIHAVREELLLLHAMIEDEASRTELLRLFHVLADVVESHLGDQQPELLQSFRYERQLQIWLLIRVECLVGEEMDLRLLRAVTKREIRAGRMSKSDPLRRYALGDASGFDAFYATAPTAATVQPDEPHPLPNTPAFHRMWHGDS